MTKIIRWLIIIGLFYGGFVIGRYILNQGMLFIFAIFIALASGILAISLFKRGISQHG